MPPEFPSLRQDALLQGATAILANTEDAVLYEMDRRGASATIELAGAMAPVNCADIDVGDYPFSDTLNALLRAICQAMQGTALRIGDFVDALAQRVMDTLLAVTSAIVSQVESIVSSIFNTLSGLVESLVARIQVVVSTIVTALTNLVQQIATIITTVIDKIRIAVQTIVDKLGTIVQAIIDKIATGFTALIRTAENVIGAIGNFFSDLIQRAIEIAVETFTFVTGKVADLIDALSNAATGALTKLRETVEDIPAAMRELVGDLIGVVGDTVGNPLAKMGDIIVAQVEDYFRQVIVDADVSPEKMLNDVLTGIGVRPEEVSRLAATVDNAMPRTPLPFVVIAGAIILSILPVVINTVLGPALQEIQQESAQRLTPTLIPPGEVLDAFLRGEMSSDRMRKELGEAGYSNERQDILVASSRRLLAVGELFRFWLRGFITEDALDEQLAMQRIAPIDMANLKLSAFPLPPVGDLIRMAVREVFSPEIRERFGQDEGFPSAFAEYGAQQGISEFWAKAYWAAHWALPSAQQGFEMLHRKVIEPDDLGLLLRALDVMPFWREKLTAIAFNPLTRVDVRRMHRLGLLSEEDLQARYETLGFNPDDAAMMVQFTIAFNADDATEAEVEIEGLTRSTVVNMFEDGILQEEEARQFLVTMGLSDRVADLFITQRKLEIERSTRSSLIESVVSLFGGGAISFPEAQDSLASIGLTAAEIAKATSRIIANLKGRQRLPTPVQLDKMLLAEIIDEPLWRESMGGLNFSEEWTQRIFELNVETGGE